MGTKEERIEFDGAPYSFQCDNCVSGPGTSEEFIITEDGYNCSSCDTYYTFDEVHGDLESRRD